MMHIGVNNENSMSFNILYKLKDGFIHAIIRLLYTFNASGFISNHQNSNVTHLTKYSSMTALEFTKRDKLDKRLLSLFRTYAETSFYISYVNSS